MNILPLTSFYHSDHHQCVQSFDTYLIYHLQEQLPVEFMT